ncbi:KAP family P-loop NTPase fold protein [Deinococcus petrolearius]|uniref:P-loop NTPase fold protein n=1 Tax=Deinococcus petrolearius TaxID=1751295 RepID=A0ABW1DMQ7_9DEIO
MWPDNESQVDLLRFKYLSDVVTAVLADDAMLPTTVGVYGDWGSGKSTLLGLVEQQFKQDSESLVVRFNGWQFEGYDDAKAALMGTILDVMQQRMNPETITERGRFLLGNLIRRVDILKVAGRITKSTIPFILGNPLPAVEELGGAVSKGLKGLADQKKLEEASKELGGYIKEKEIVDQPIRENIRAFQSEFAELIGEAKYKRVVVMIDDLDRCLPRTLVETLEAIKLFLMVPHTAFLIAADELLVQHSIRSVYGAERMADGRGGQRDLGRDYLEKLIQVPIRLPRLSRAENESYLFLLHAQKHLSQEQFQVIVRHVEEFAESDLARRPFDVETARKLRSSGQCAISQDLEDDLLLMSNIAPILVPRLEGSPRRTKRFLNTLHLRLRLSKARKIDLDPKILAKLMTLEDAQLNTFRGLAELQARQSGMPDELREAERQVRAEKTAQPKVKPVASRSSVVQTWTADVWMRRWLDTEPFLTDVNLQPYFFIAHDRLGLLDEEASLSARAAEVVSNLLAKNQFMQARAKELAKDLTELEQGQVVSALATRAGSSTGEELRNCISAVLELARIHPSLQPQALQLLVDLPAEQIPFALMPTIEGVFGDVPALQIPFDDLLGRWGRSKNTPLANSANKVITKRAKSGTE